MSGDVMDAVLPLLARDLPRAQILLCSLQRNFRGLGRLWLIVPSRERRVVEQALGASTFGAASLGVVAEDELVPELSRTRMLRGWYRQQLLKLAVAPHVATENYLTLDADVICVRNASPEALAPGGKGLCHVIAEDLHPDWYRGSLSVLGLPAKRRGVLHNVTPAVLNRRAVLALQHHLAERAARGEFRRDLTGLRQRWLMRRLRGQGEPWRLYLIVGAPWTEYALYYSFLEATDQFEAYHTLTSDCLYAVHGSVWRADAAHFASWDPAPLFRGSGAPYFAIVQSITRLPPEQVWAKVAPFLAQH